MNYHQYFKKIVKQINPKTFFRTRNNFVILIYIIYGLYYSKAFQKRYEFKKRYPLLNKIYERLINAIGKKLSVDVKQCIRCGILFIPDYRVKERQHNCPYGCVEDNHKENVKCAKVRYHNKLSGRQQISENNRTYRERKKLVIRTQTVSKVSFLPEPDKLTKQILFIYRQLNPQCNEQDLKKMSLMLKKIAVRCKSERDTIFTNLEKRLYWLLHQQYNTVRRKK